MNDLEELIRATLQERRNNAPSEFGLLEGVRAGLARRVRLRRGTFAAAVAVILVGGSLGMVWAAQRVVPAAPATATSTPKVPMTPTAPGTSGPSNDPSLQHAADAIVPFLTASFPDSYAGVTLDEATHAVIVFRRPAPALDAAVRARVGPAHVVFRDARFSLVELRNLQQRVLSDASYWKSRGITIAGVAPSADGSGVTVGTPDVTAARVALPQRYGADTVTIVESQGYVPD